MLSHTISTELQSLFATERAASLGASAGATLPRVTSDGVDRQRVDTQGGGARPCPPVPGTRPAATR